MFLYDKNKKSLDIYDFTASKEDLINYRITQMEQIPETERVFVAETHIDQYGDSPLFEKYTGKTFNDKILSASYADNDSEKRKNSDAYRRYHVLKNDNRSKINNKMLLDYYEGGHLTDRSVVKIQYPEIIKYYLLKNARYDFAGLDEYGCNYKMGDIIQLPESLYLLQLLEQGKFTSFNGKDISKQLELYTLAKINEINLEEIQKMDACGITQDAYSNVIKKAENDTHILKLIKK